MSNPEDVTLARLSALGNPQRWKIIVLLMAWEPLSVSELVQRSGLDQPKVSHHLAILRANGLVDAGRDGRTRPYTLSDVWDKRENAIALICGGGKVKLEINAQPWIETD